MGFTIERLFIRRNFCRALRQLYLILPKSKYITLSFHSIVCIIDRSDCSALVSREVKGENLKITFLYAKIAEQVVFYAKSLSCM